MNPAPPPRALAPRCAASAALLVSLWATPAGAQEPAGRAVAAGVRAGVEVDDNPLRRAGEEHGADLLTRYFADLDASSRQGASLYVLNLSQGGKLFRQVDAADTLLTQVGLLWRRRLPGRLELGAALDLKDRTERVSLQDYTRGGAQAQARWSIWRMRLTGRAGWRFFAYRPNPAASSRGPSAGASLDVGWTRTWITSLSYTWLDRRFEATRLELDGDGDASGAASPLPVPSGPDRQDDFHAVRAAVDWRGPALINLSYTLSLNRSNSYGQDLTRHNVELAVTTPLPLGLLGSGRVDLQRTLYEDPVFLDANFRIDEDNRNALIASLSRPIGQNWDVELRYSFYTQEFGVGDDYRRQTLFMGVGYALSSRERTR